MSAPCANCQAVRNVIVPLDWMKVDRLWRPFDAGQTSGAVHRCYRDHYATVDAKRAADAVRQPVAVGGDPLGAGA